MSLSSVNPYTSTLRIGGLATGMDTDQIVSDLMRVEKIPYDRLYQKRQLAEWKRDNYREITSLLSGFRSGFFDYLSPSTNMLSQSTYKQFGISVTDSVSGEESTAVTVSTTSSSMEGTHTIRVDTLATADKAVSSSTVTAELEATPTDYSLSGKTVRVTLDGVTRELELDDYSDLDDLIGKADTGLQDLVDNAFGSGKITVSNASGKLRFETGGGASRITLASGTTNDALADLGFESGDSNRLRTGYTLEALADNFDTALTFDASDQVVFTINNAEFTFDKTDTLSSVMSTINSDTDANVNLSYDEVTDKFVLTSKQLGDGDNITVTQTGGTFLDSMQISTADPVTEEGVDAQVVIDGETVTRSSNTFTVNGLTYTLLKESANEQDISMTLDEDAIYDKIVAFVEKYNEVIAAINSELNEEYDSDYLPLTEEQRDAMSEDEIELWEERAKTGLLRNDEVLQNIVYDMRRALYDSVEDVNGSLTSIGITTGTYDMRGQLVIDEDELKEAIRNSPDTVMNLFSKQSDTEYADWENRETRYDEEGLAYRLYDVLQDNIRTTRDDDGYKGILLEKAGLEGDVSEYTNTMYKSITSINERMDVLFERLLDKEERYYSQFTELEKAISDMNSQMNWLMTQLGMWQQ